MDNNILLKPSAAIYETHFFGKEKTPFIFHKDAINKYSLHNVHENIEFLYVTDGKGDVYCDNKKFITVAGDIITINSHATHQVVSEDGIIYYCLIVDMRFFDENAIDVNNIYFNPLVKDEVARRLFEQIVGEYENKDSFQAVGIRSAILAFLLYLCRNQCQPLKEAASHNSDTLVSVQKAVNFIKANLSKKLTTDSIAASVGVSKYHFIRQFKKVTGYTICTYINILRCEYAKQLLKDRKHSIKDIALLCGFENFSYFAKVFKTYTSYVPSEYIKLKGEKK